MNQFLLQEGYDTLLGDEYYNVDTDVKYQKLLNEIPHWVWETDAQLTVVYSNFRVHEIVGCQLTEIIGIPITDVLSDDESNLIDFNLIINRLKNSKERKIAFKHSIRRKDHSIRHLKTVIIPNRDYNNRVIGFLGITHDQTSQIIAENTLRESEHKLQLVLSNLSEVVFMLDTTGVITFVSPSVEKILWISTDKILGRSFFDFFNKLNPNAIVPILKKFKKALKLQQCEFQHEFELNIRNVRCIFEVSVNVLYDSTLTFKGITGVIRDITRKRRAEADIRAAFNGAIDSMSVILEQHDVYTSGHQRNVARLSVQIAHQMGLNDHQIEGLRIAAMLHDIGKVSIPTEILNRPGKLNRTERQIVERHPELGAKILRQIPFPWDIARFVGEHHERIDGSGYPYGLKGNEISLEAKIIGVADTLDSIVNHRPYKPAQKIEKAVEIIKNEKGVKFDCTVVEAMLVLYFKGVLKSYSSPKAINF